MSTRIVTIVKMVTRIAMGWRLSTYCQMKSHRITQLVSHDVTRCNLISIQHRALHEITHNPNESHEDDHSKREESNEGISIDVWMSVLEDFY